MYHNKNLKCITDLEKKYVILNCFQVYDSLKNLNFFFYISFPHFCMCVYETDNT